jgi:hypothetical protein
MDELQETAADRHEAHTDHFCTNPKCKPGASSWHPGCVISLTKAVTCCGDSGAMWSMKEEPMKARAFGSVCVAAVLASGMVLAAQGAGQQPSQPQTQPSTRSSADEQITVTGCIQREADYRRAHDAGKGGAVGTGVGVGNEFVLTNASASTTTPGAPPAEPSSPTGTAGTTAAGSMAYELTGTNEGQASQFVGRRVEISGRLKPAETSAGGKPTGGATAGEPPKGVDVTSKDLTLRELEVTSVREAKGSCPAMK